VSAAVVLLHALRRRGVEIHAEGDRLRWRAPRGVVTPDDLDALKAAKAEIVAALEAEQEPPADWLARRSRDWLLHLLDHDPDRATLADAHELARADWRISCARAPGGVQ
jgi:hypothetical protein